MRIFHDRANHHRKLLTAIPAFQKAGAGRFASEPVDVDRSAMDASRPLRPAKILEILRGPDLR